MQQDKQINNYNTNSIQQTRPPSWPAVWRFRSVPREHQFIETKHACRRHNWVPKQICELALTTKMQGLCPQARLTRR